MLQMLDQVDYRREGKIMRQQGRPNVATSSASGMRIVECIAMRCAQYARRMYMTCYVPNHCMLDKVIHVNDDSTDAVISGTEALMLFYTTNMPAFLTSYTGSSLVHALSQILRFQGRIEANDGECTTRDVSKGRKRINDVGEDQPMRMIQVINWALGRFKNGLHFEENVKYYEALYGDTADSDDDDLDYYGECDDDELDLDNNASSFGHPGNIVKTYNNSIHQPLMASQPQIPPGMKGVDSLDYSLHPVCENASLESVTQFAHHRFRLRVMLALNPSLVLIPETTLRIARIFSVRNNVRLEIDATFDDDASSTSSSSHHTRTRQLFTGNVVHVDQKIRIHYDDNTMDQYDLNTYRDRARVCGILPLERPYPDGPTNKTLERVYTIRNRTYFQSMGVLTASVKRLYKWLNALEPPSTTSASDASMNDIIANVWSQLTMQMRRDIAGVDDFVSGHSHWAGPHQERKRTYLRTDTVMSQVHMYLSIVRRLLRQRVLWDTMCHINLLQRLHNDVSTVAWEHHSVYRSWITVETLNDALDHDADPDQDQDQDDPSQTGTCANNTATCRNAIVVFTSDFQATLRLHYLAMRLRWNARRSLYMRCASLRKTLTSLLPLPAEVMTPPLPTGDGHLSTVAIHQLQTSTTHMQSAAISMWRQYVLPNVLAIGATWGLTQVPSTEYLNNDHWSCLTHILFQERVLPSGDVGTVVDEPQQYEYMPDEFVRRLADELSAMTVTNGTLHGTLLRQTEHRKTIEQLSGDDDTIWLLLEAIGKHIAKRSVPTHNPSLARLLDMVSAWKGAWNEQDVRQCPICCNCYLPRAKWTHLPMAKTTAALQEAPHHARLAAYMTYRASESERAHAELGCRFQECCRECTQNFLRNAGKNCSYFGPNGLQCPLNCEWTGGWEWGTHTQEEDGDGNRHGGWISALLSSTLGDAPDETTIRNQLTVRFRQNRIKHDPSLIECVSCQGGYVDVRTHPLQCNECGHTLCPECYQEIHPSMTCAERAQATQTLVQELVDQDGMACPRCYMLSVRIDGCNHIECPSCSFMYCWTCGKEQRQRNVPDCKPYSDQTCLPVNERRPRFEVGLHAKRAKEVLARKERGGGEGGRSSEGGSSGEGGRSSEGGSGRRRHQGTF